MGPEVHERGDERLTPRPALPTFTRTRSGWRHSSWLTVRRKLAKKNGKQSERGNGNGISNAHGVLQGIHSNVMLSPSSSYESLSDHGVFPPDDPAPAFVHARQVSVSSSMKDMKKATGGWLKKGVKKVKGLFGKK